MLKELGLQDEKSSTIPTDTEYQKLKDNEETFEDKQQLQSIIDMLLYISVNARPDMHCYFGQKSSKTNEK